MIRRATETTNERVVHDEMMNFNLFIETTREGRIICPTSVDLG